jgi:hypothetical protein
MLVNKPAIMIARFLLHNSASGCKGKVGLTVGSRVKESTDRELLTGKGLRLSGSPD